MTEVNYITLSGEIEYSIKGTYNDVANRAIEYINSVDKHYKKRLASNLDIIPDMTNNFTIIKEARLPYEVGECTVVDVYKDFTSTKKNVILSENNLQLQIGDIIPNSNCNWCWYVEFTKPDGNIDYMEPEEDVIFYIGIKNIMLLFKQIISDSDDRIVMSEEFVMCDDNQTSLKDYLEGFTQDELSNFHIHVRLSLYDSNITRICYHSCKK